MASTLQYAIAQGVAAAAWSPPYDWTNNYISDLGNTACENFHLPHAEPRFVCSPLHAIMNGSFILSGFLVIAGTVSIWTLWSTRKIAITAQVLWLTAGIGRIMVGLVPENADLGLHAAAAINIPLGNTAVLLVSIAIFKKCRMFAVTGLILSIGSFGALGLSIAAQFARPGLLLGLGVGGMERLTAYPANLWLLMAGVVVLAWALVPGSGISR